ncbi:sterol esterase [Mycena polygramma]|nr:sterol esterase [Mycena polygramma]
MNYAFSLALLVSLFSNEPDVCLPAETAVELSYGSFQGIIVGNVTQSLGIPFAKSPVGDLRFREPMAPVHVPGVRLVDKFGAACPQQTLAPIPGLNFTGNYGSISEDCLTINVLKPVQQSHDLPVLVWFHGGGFEIGDASDTIMNSILERSLERGKPIVIVIPNYRLNAFGFLAGKEVMDAGVGNLGLRDQKFALEWVQAHISAFGGDPNRVIIAGLSAGAISVGMHLVASDAEYPALFHGAFMESGATSSIPHVLEGQPQYDQLVAATNCTDATDTLDCLRHAPFDVLMSAINRTPNIFSYSSMGNVPIIAGDCDDEGTLFSLANMNITTDQQFLEYMHHNYLPAASQDEISNLGVMYPSDPASGSPFGTGQLNAVTPQFKRLAAVQGDLIFQGPRRNLLSKVSRTQDAWGYLSKRGKSVPILGASHGCDVNHWLGTAGENDFGVNALIQFVNTLDPNLPADEAIRWPEWNALDHGALLSFSDSRGVEVIADDFREEAIAFLNDLNLRLGNSSEWKA